MNRRVLNPLLLVLAFVLGSYAVWQWRQRQGPPPAPPQRSDYVLRDYELITLNEAGEEAFTVVGPELERDPQGKTLTLDQPRFSFPAKGGGRWNARSDSAWVSAKADEVRLLARVEMVGPPGETGDRTVFATDRLFVFPDAQTASSGGRVTVTHGDSILAGTGLEVDMQAKRFQLLNDVKGRY
ncbi:MAG: LPS export ABC transporter periplasmic protein LptC, partial [Lysobacterales bacterium GWF1_69_6]